MLKNKNTVVLIGVLAVLVVIYLIVQLTDGKSRSKSFRETLVDINKGKVSRIEIRGKESNTVLKGGPDNWEVEISDGVSKPAKVSSVTNFLSSLETIEPSRIASRSKDKWMDFQVDSAGTRVKVFEGDNETLDIILGRFGVEGQRSFYTYVRLADDNDTYVANNFMSMSISSTPDGFRMNDVFRLSKDSLMTIAFNYPDSAFTINKSESGQWIIEGQPVDSTNMAKYLNGLRNVTNKSFDDGSFDAPILDVTYMFNNRDNIQVSMDQDGTVKSSENEVELFNDEALREKLFKGRSYFF